MTDRSTSLVEYRQARRSGPGSPAEFRTPFQKDRDRILYSHAFLRLEGVTQVSSGTTPGLGHNRFSHSIKVGQVGAALARTLTAQYRQVIPGIENLVDPWVVEAAGLAHDIGHPPTGHNGEKAINEWLQRETGQHFEGNAQTFRILARLGDGAFGKTLDLTRATLQAACKYPWGVDAAVHDKFGYYPEEQDTFHWASSAAPVGNEIALDTGTPSIEAQLMDWADDITYAIHDAQDWYRAHRLPLHRMLDRGSPELTDFVRWLWTELHGRASLWEEYDALNLAIPLPDPEARECPDLDPAFETYVVGRLAVIPHQVVDE